jgi:hypothetical protein
MSDNVKMMVARFNIFDAELGISVNRGQFVEAPADFFVKYGKSYMPPGPRVVFDPKKHIKITIDVEKWKKIQEFFAKKQPDGKKTPLLAKSISDIETPQAETTTAPQKRPGMSGTKDGAVPGAKEGETADGEEVDTSTDAEPEKKEETPPPAPAKPPAGVSPKNRKKPGPKKKAPAKKKPKKG